MARVPFETKIAGYAHPEVLMSTAWVAENLTDPSVQVVESSGDVLHYQQGHIPGAVHLDWRKELHDPVRRDIVCREGFEALMAGKGINQDAVVVLYGDQGNRYATYTLWVFKLYGHGDVRIMDGGRRCWEKEGRAWTQDAPSYPPSTYRATGPDLSLRAYRDEVFRQMEAGRPLVDVRSEAEYRGERPHAPNKPRSEAERGGHIPGAQNIPWAVAIHPDDDTFKSWDDLRALYGEKGGIGPHQEVTTYCHVGERSSHTWFVLTYLLGHPQVKNYDGSWMEWGNLIGAPIER